LKARHILDQHEFWSVPSNELDKVCQKIRPGIAGFSTAALLGKRLARCASRKEHEWLTRCQNGVIDRVEWQISHIAA